MSKPTTPIRSASTTVATTAENVTVTVRVKPLADRIDQPLQLPLHQHTSAWDVRAGPRGSLSMTAECRDRLRRNGLSVDYTFDHVCVGSENESLYRDCVASVVWSAMEGYNGTVFAYGQTSSGKTYTMMGNEDRPGVIPRAVDDVFAYIQANSDQREFLLRVSYMEIYNETIHDLLSPGNQELRLHEDKYRGVYVAPLREDIVTSPEAVMQIIREGEVSRHVSSTDYNEHSSRSHTIFQLLIESRLRQSTSSPAAVRSTAASALNRSRSDLAPNGGPVRFSALSLIDLAGSEKASSSLDRRREGAYINKSLLTLGAVIAKLTEDRVGGHIPYRDSKLTRLLQPSLQGQARISVICTVSPAMTNVDESSNTLKFAQRIKKVVTNAGQTEIMDDKALLQKYRSEIYELKTRLVTLSTKEQESSQLAAEKLRLEEELQQQQLVRTALKERIDHLTKLILTSSSYNSQAILNPTSTSETAGSRLTFSGRRPSNSRSSVIVTSMSTSPKSPGTDCIGEDVLRLEVERLKNECTHLQTTLDSKDNYIQQLLDELKEVRASKSIAGLKSSSQESLTSDNDGSVDLQVRLLQKQVLQSQRRCQEQEVLLQEQEERLRDMDEELLRLKMKSPPLDQVLVNLNDVRNTSIADVGRGETPQTNPDEILELRHQVDQYRSRLDECEMERKQQVDYIAKLEHDLAALQPYLMQASGRGPRTELVPLPEPPSLNDIYPNRTPAQSQYAQLLSSLLKTSSPPPALKVTSVGHTRPNTVTPSAPISMEQFKQTDVIIKALQEQLSEEKKLRMISEKKQDAELSTLQTELDITKTELSVAQLLSHYATPLDTPSHRLSLTDTSSQYRGELSRRSSASLLKRPATQPQGGGIKNAVDELQDLLNKMK